MKYLCLAYYNGAKFDSLPQVEVNARLSQCKDHDKVLHDSDQLLLVASLAAT